jgi:hypothetical protein
VKRTAVIVVVVPARMIFRIKAPSICTSQAELTSTVVVSVRVEQLLSLKYLFVRTMLEPKWRKTP